MKKLLLAIPFLVSLNSQASLIQAVGDSDEAIVLSESCRKSNGLYMTMAQELGCGLISTLSLPTLVVASSELDPESEEVWLEILAETVSESAHRPVTQEVANFLGKDVTEVEAAVLKRYTNR